jgi:hypothetical protein
MMGPTGFEGVYTSSLTISIVIVCFTAYSSSFTGYSSTGWTNARFCLMYLFLYFMQMSLILCVPLLTTKKKFPIIRMMMHKFNDQAQ